MRLLYRSLFVLTLLGGGVAAWLLPITGPADALSAAAPSPDVQRRQEIEFYERRLREDAHSALDMAQLAGLLLEEGRMSGDERAFVQAESLALRSLGERTKRNGRSAALLANALLAQHRFGEAVVVARELVQSDSAPPAYRALLAEVEMEVGDYQNAVRLLGSLRANREDLGIAPAFARWAELTGRTGDARRILAKASHGASERDDLTGQQRAWFSLRLADFELRHGNVRGAASAIAQGLEQSPGDWRLLLARARLESAKGQWQQAIKSAEDVLSMVPSPDALALLATAHRTLRHSDDAAAFDVALEQVGLSGTGSKHRSWMIAMLDNGSGDERLLTLALADTLVRHDVHTLDLAAWALFRSGRASEALALARRAMALGSNEPSLRYHAALIEFAAGDAEIAEQHRHVALNRSRALTPAQIRELRAAVPTTRN